MTFAIGHLTIRPGAVAPTAPARPAAAPGPVRIAARATAVDAADAIPASPPQEVLAEVDAAWERAARLAAANRELHFNRDAGSGRTIIEVRTLAGEVLRTIPPARMLEVIGGGAL